MKYQSVGSRVQEPRNTGREVGLGGGGGGVSRSIHGECGLGLGCGE